MQDQVIFSEFLRVKIFILSGKKHSLNSDDPVQLVADKATIIHVDSGMYLIKNTHTN